MARKENPWLPSGGVLVVAIVAAVVAAILLNIYISYIEAPYKVTVPYLALKQDVAKGEVLEEGHLTVVEIPEPLLAGGAFKRFVPLSDKSVVLRKRARWDLYKGNLLAYRDVLKEFGEPVLKEIPEGYEMLTIEIEPEPSIQPGVFVTIRGRFDMDPDPKRTDVRTLDILYDVQVKAVGGSSEATETRRRSIDNIQICLPGDHVKKLLNLKEKMEGDRFVVAVRRSPEGIRGEPTFAPEALELLRKESAAPPPALR